jgi:hypothetical protein
MELAGIRNVAAYYEPFIHIMSRSKPRTLPEDPQPGAVPAGTFFSGLIFATIPL